MSVPEGAVESAPWGDVGGQQSAPAQARPPLGQLPVSIGILFPTPRE